MHPAARRALGSFPNLHSKVAPGVPNTRPQVCLSQSAHCSTQVVETESTFTIHHANAFEDPDAPGDLLVWSSGWGPATLAAVAARAKAAKEKARAALALCICRCVLRPSATWKGYGPLMPCAPWCVLAPPAVSKTGKGAVGRAAHAALRQQGPLSPLLL